MTKTELKSVFSKNSKNRGFRASATELISRWRYRGHTGRLIQRHRALRRLEVQTSSIAHPLLLTTGFFGLILGLRHVIMRFWADVVGFWCGLLGIDIFVRTRPVPAFGTVLYERVEARLASPYPTSIELQASLLFALAVMLISYLGFRRFLPLTYLFWAVSFIQIGAIAFFHFYPGYFPYSIGAHLASVLDLSLVLLFVIPLLLLVAYYPLNFSFVKKLFLSTVVLSALVLFIPHLFTCHLVIMEQFSVLYMPLLFAIFTVLPLLLIVVSLYGWGMSWARQS